MVNRWNNAATRPRLGLAVFISIFTKHWSWVLLKSYWRISSIIYVCLYREWFSPYICVWEPKWLMEQSSHLIRKRQGWKKGSWEIIKLRVDKINVHKIVKVMSKMNTELLFPKSCNVWATVYWWNYEEFGSKHRRKLFLDFWNLLPKMWRHIRIHGQQVWTEIPSE